MDDHHRFLLTSLLTHIDFLEEQISDCNRKIEQVLSELSDEKAELVSSDDQLQNQALVSSTPVGTESLLAQERVPEDGPKVPLSYQQAITLLESILGINQRIAEIFLAEVGTDMVRRIGGSERRATKVAGLVGRVHAYPPYPCSTELESRKRGGSGAWWEKAA